MNIRRLSLHITVMLIGTLLFCKQIQAATYVNQTRLIVTEKSREVSFSIVNEGDAPVLMQLWSDRGTLLERPEIIKMPFIITPPVFRLEGGKSRAIRLQLVGYTQDLVADRESIFWLNALEVPQKPNVSNNRNVLQMAFRTRIKLLYRPAATATTTIEDAVKTLRTVISSSGVKLENRSPLHISLLSVTLAGGRTLSSLPNEGTLAPFTDMEIPLSHVEPLAAVTWIDDFGVAHVNRF